MTRSHNETLRHYFGTTVSACTKRIERTRSMATTAEIVEGVGFYPSAFEFCQALAQHETVRTVERGAAMVAALSPRTYWDKNVVHATACAAGATAKADYASPVMQSNIDRALRVLAADNPLVGLGNGPKVNAFYANIMGETEPVTIDTWAMRIALGIWMDDETAGKLSRKGVYEALAHCYRVAARKANITPRDMQAITWITARNHKDMFRR